MLFSHQGMSQLVKGDIDLSEIIFQAQSRLIFGVQGRDADLLAEELASLNFDPYRMKAEIYSRRQWLTGHKIVELQSHSFAQQQAESWQKTVGDGWGEHTNITKQKDADPIESRGKSRSGQKGEGQGGSSGSTYTTSVGEHLVPVHEEFEELASRTYFTFDEDLRKYARDIRRAKRSQAFLLLVDDDTLYFLDVIRSAPGHLAWDIDTLLQFYPEAIEAMEQLKELNFQSDMFVSPQVIDREAQERLQRVLRPRIELHDQEPEAGGPEPSGNPLD